MPVASSSTVATVLRPNCYDRCSRWLCRKFCPNFREHPFQTHSSENQAMYAYIHETGRGFFAGCSGKRIGHSLFATHPHPAIRELTLEGNLRAPSDM